MFRFIKRLFGKTSTPKAPEPMDMLRKTGSHKNLKPAARPAPRPTATTPKRRATDRPQAPAKAPPKDVVDGTAIEENGPGKNVLVRQRFVREDTGTHETLKILDDSLVDSDDEAGLDPYNTGRFDRSKHWDARFRK